MKKTAANLAANLTNTLSVPDAVPIPVTTTTADEINKSMSVAVDMPKPVKPFKKQ